MTRIALFQSNTGVAPDANARSLADAIEATAGGGAEMLFTPEMSGLLDRNSERAAKSLRPQAEDKVLQSARGSRCPPSYLASSGVARRAG